MRPHLRVGHERAADRREAVRRRGREDLQHVLAYSCGSVPNRDCSCKDLEVDTHPLAYSCGRGSPQGLQAVSHDQLTAAVGVLDRGLQAVSHDQLTAAVGVLDRGLQAVGSGPPSAAPVA